MNRTGFFVASAVVIGGLVASAVFWPKQEGVILYCATDDVIARPILDAFESETGIHVKAEWDTEASKTIGRANALKQEKANPRCDVFWNNEILQTVRLAQDGVFEPYVSPSAADIPAEFKEATGLWTGFAARPRILIVTTDPEMWGTDPERPSSMDDLVKPKWKRRAVLAEPLSGTTLTHALVLLSVLGEARGTAWLEAVHANCLSPVGNGPASKIVGDRQALFGFADIDDFHEQERNGKPVTVLYPDQAPGQPGTLLLPNTIALVKGGPNPALGRKLVDYLLSRKVEEALAAADAAQVPLRPDVPRPAHVKVAPKDFRAMKVDWQDAAKDYDRKFEKLQAMWGR